jgi:hypothetical protein
VQHVEKIELKIWHTNPAALVISCHGKSHSPGWTSARLTPYIYFMPQADGIYEFELVAEPPTGSTSQAERTLTAEFVWPHFPPYLSGIKVYAQDNAVVATIQPLAAMKLKPQATTGFPSGYFQHIAGTRITAIAFRDSTDRQLHVHGLLHTNSNDDAVLVKSAQPNGLHPTEYDMHLTVIEGEGPQKGVYKPFSFQAMLAQPCHQVYILFGEKEKISIAVESSSHRSQRWPER